jgi:hypothetical protein
MQQKLASFQSAAQTGFESLPLDHLQVHFRRKKLEIVSTFFLSVVHGCVRVLNQSFSILSVSWEDADPDAPIDVQFVTADGMGRAEGMQYFFGTDGSMLRMSDFREQDYKFISALAAYRIRIAYRSQQSQGNGLKKLVTDEMP